MIARFSLCLGLVLAISVSANSTISSLISLDKIGRKLGLAAETSSTDGVPTLTMHGKGVRLEFAMNSRIVDLNGIRTFLGDPIVTNGGKFFVTTDDWNRILRPILQPHLYPPPPQVKRVVIDAGHGGRDPGAQNAEMGHDEKDLALDLALRVGKLLDARGFEVILTRGDDRFISLDSRPGHSNRVKADVFISIHFNAARAEVRGVETFAYTLAGDPSTGRSRVESSDQLSRPGNQNDPWNSLLGYYLQRELVKASGEPDRGLKRARFAVLETLSAPGVLLELGFMSNPTTAARLKDTRYRDQLAIAVAKGIESYSRTANRLREID